MVVALVTATLNLGAAVLRLLQTSGVGVVGTEADGTGDECTGGGGRAAPSVMSPPLAEGAGEPSGRGERS